ncbi:glycosyltransferase family 2 protein [Devosia sp. SL43]|uniref:glycosyltransferase family 2 protein n=1 Tax=Devosia sp. SL43 TaxID=2806348 RepID=UPI001F3F4248|nr:glycosyltransferase family 2 protein [Devosia sp. SL43]UJW87432.1 glycosyltransferase family 2 protein [Devosia sp. SL43]
MNRHSVDICVCTFRRAYLAETLASIARLDARDIAIRVVISDNDHTPSARALVESVAAGFPFPITYLHSPAANISIARNACLDAATADFIAFVDDDEVVSPLWLQHLLAKATETGAGVVLGPVRAVYSPSAPRWLTEGDFHSTLPVQVGGTIRTGYTCNVLMRWQMPLSAQRFDLSLGKSGGEDTDFFYRYSDAGGAIAFAPEAWIDEPVPTNRAAMNWLLSRRLRSGQTHGARLRAKTRFAIPAACIAAAKAAACLGMAVVSAYSPIGWRKNLLRGVLHLGVIGGLYGAAQPALYGQQRPS